MEKTKFIFISVLVLICNAVAAQDRIYFNDRAPVDAVVKEIGDDYVLYRMWNNQDGPDFRSSLSKVDRIVFANGTESVFRDGRMDAEDMFDDLVMSGAVVPGRLEYRHGRYYTGFKVLAPDQIRDYIGYRDYGSVYLKARRQYTAGTYLTYFGAGALFIGALMVIADATAPSFSSDFGDDSSLTGIGAVCCVLGAAGIASGIPLLVKGNRQMDAIADDYNSRHGYSMRNPEKEISLTLGPCRSGGLGLAFNF